MNKNYLEVQESIELPQPIEKVWEVLTDFEKYPQWNPYIRKVTGKFAVNETLWVQIGYPFVVPFYIAPQVIAISPPYSFSWGGKFLLPGLLDGLFLVVLYPLEPKLTRVVLKEQLEGIFLFLPISVPLQLRIHQSLQQMLIALSKYFSIS
ncbi:MAG: SRPBCC domain-containing protein [Bacteroidia bacterium]|nr:SRPBCC domain-containing protein [Bacteroidia bacterium]MDW8159122.1 SRPBCC domain-containing protein [Bacteroidia bacterium]